MYNTFIITLNSGEEIRLERVAHHTFRDHLVFRQHQGSYWIEDYMILPLHSFKYIKKVVA